MEWLLLLAAVAFAAGFVDTVAGGGGLITVPAFLFAGFAPAEALATNKCQAFAGTLTASTRFILSGHLRLRTLWPFALLAFISSLAGAWMLREVSNAAWLELAIPLLLLLAALYFGFAKLPESLAKQKPVFGFLAITGICLVGFYDGFFGPGAGSFFAILMVAVLGLAVRKATIYAKLFNTMTNVAALTVFATSDLVNWSAVLVMIPGQVFGAMVGTYAILGRGIVLVRPTVVAICILMAIKLASDVLFP